MFKEFGHGSSGSLQRIIEKFKIQMGVKDATVKDYIETLIGSGLLTVFRGSGRWRYNAEEEWDLFHVPVNQVCKRGGD
jgi:hypothetical protein